MKRTPFKCKTCESELVPYYPDFIDHVSLIKEVIDNKDAIAYALLEEDKLVGFAWGYDVTYWTTKDPKKYQSQIDDIHNRGLTLDEVFCLKEISVDKSIQGMGYGSALTARVIEEVINQKRYKEFITRTLNRKLVLTCIHIFNGKYPKIAYRSKRKNFHRYCWNMKDVDLDALTERANRIQPGF